MKKEELKINLLILQRGELIAKKERIEDQINQISKKIQKIDHHIQNFTVKDSPLKEEVKRKSISDFQDEFNRSNRG